MERHVEVDLVDLLTRARSGDGTIREHLIAKYRPFVLSTVSRVTGRYTSMSDDEASIGLLAFNEAIDRYDRSRGASFVSFAETVIRRRLIDHLRRQPKREFEIPFSSLGVADQEEGQSCEDAQNQQSIAEYSIRLYEEERRDEIVRYSERLKAYGISFAELAVICPRHEDARRNAIAAARVLAAVPELRERLVSQHEVPMKELERQVSISRKTLERQRRYIIAIAIIFIEGFEHLREYVDK